MSETITVGKFTLTLCPEGHRLRQAWIDAMNNRANPDEIYKAMRAYFTHRNGIQITHTKKTNACWNCTSWGNEALK